MAKKPRSEFIPATISKPTPIIVEVPPVKMDKEPQSEIYLLLNELKLEKYYEVLVEYGISTCNDIILLEQDDWRELNVTSFHQKRILKKAQETITSHTIIVNTDLSPKKLEIIKTTLEKKTNNEDIQHGVMSNQSREERRRDPPTARLQPGKRFLDHVPDAPQDQNSVLECLYKWAESKKLDTLIIDDTIGKIEDYRSEWNENESLSLALCWLYTTDSWVYKQMNILLRNDSPSIKILAPYMSSLMKSYNYLKQQEDFFYEGVVYRRTKLIGKDLDFYKPSCQFIWSAFTSTTVTFDSNPQFGDILFVITIPPKYKKYALNIQSVSDFKTEQEILLLPNIGYVVKKIEKGPVDDFPNSSVVIHLVVSYVCVT